MLYDICFDISALIIYSTLIILFLSHKIVNSRQNTLFMLFLVGLISTALLSIASSYLLGNTDANPNLTLTILYFYKVSLAAIPLGYFFFVESFSFKENEPFPKKALWANAIFIVQVICLAICFATGNSQYQINEAGQVFETNPFIAINKVEKTAMDVVAIRSNAIFYSTYIFSFMIFILAGIRIRLSHSRIPVKSIITIFSFFVLITLTQILQIYVNDLIFYPDHHFELFSISFAISCIIIYSIIQKPDSFLNEHTGCLNQTAFRITGSRLFKKKKAACVGILIEDFYFLCSTFTFDTIYKILKQVPKAIYAYIRNQEIFKNKSSIKLYHVKQEQFCLVFEITNESTEELYDKISRFTEGLNKALQKRRWDQTDITLYFRLITFMPDDIVTSDNTMDTLDTVENDSITRANFKSPIIEAKDIDNSKKKDFIFTTEIIRENLQNDKFEVYYQPIYSCKKRRICAAEALVRMKDKNGKFMNPEIFIPISEKNGTISSIGERVFEKVCQMIRHYKPENYGIEKINVNLSVVQCMSEDLNRQLVDIADRYNIPHTMFNFEITETAYSNYFDTLKNNVEGFVNQGIELSLDDYGSGLANLNYILQLPFSKIKIDKEIVWMACKKEKAMVALKSTTKMIKDMNLNILAEGVETEEQMQCLIDMGYDYLQGYFFSKPVPAEEFMALVKSEKEKHPELYKDLEPVDEDEITEENNDDEIEELDYLEEL
ncbi:MAG: EAL domain-containing protein [Treponemataceae bacterium]|nr:EAL domain-containing protein [Treponemataceae bacterium]